MNGPNDFIAICLRPGMFVQSASYEAVASFIDGYNEACNRRPLREFTCWLRKQCTESETLPWFSIVRKLCLPHQAPIGRMNESDSDLALKTLATLLADFGKCSQHEKGRANDEA